ncbi:hypothetical protein F4808DRAFT_35233 [Astrocystis sublimbata]|nr:hypothetical protein F4808DRAFT_35233 [Astrocystis sublimbata]
MARSLLYSLQNTHIHTHWALSYQLLASRLRATDKDIPLSFHPMDHVRKYFKVQDVLVENITTLGQYSFPTDSVTFHAFLRERGWAFDQDYKLSLCNDSQSNLLLNTEENLAVFLQSWLFFGLIFTIVQEDGRPILTYDKLLGDDRQYISTSELNGAIEKWQQWESQHIDGIKLRLIRVEGILDLARRVTRKNCSFNKHSQLSRGNPLYVHDSIALSLMVLGETLSAAKAQILRNTPSELRGWHRDDGEGWGRPRYVWVRMHEEHWCPRTCFLWQSHLRSNATLLLHRMKPTQTLRGLAVQATDNAIRIVASSRLLMTPTTISRRTRTAVRKIAGQCRDQIWTKSLSF